MNAKIVGKYIWIIVGIGMFDIARPGWGGSVTDPDFTITGTVTGSNGQPVNDDGSVSVTVPLGIPTTTPAKIGPDGSYSLTFTTNEPSPLITVTAFRDTGQIGHVTTSDLSQPINIQVAAPPPPQVTSAGKGKVDPFGPPPTSLAFSPSSFLPGTFSMSATLLLPNSSTITLHPLDFHILAEFTPTAQPNILQARLSQAEFDYAPFSIPGTGLTGINREVLDNTTPGFAGVLDLNQGKLYLPLAVQWLNTSGAVVATSDEFFDLSITPTSPTVDSVTFTASLQLLPRFPKQTSFIPFSIAVVGLLSLAQPPTAIVAGESNPLVELRPTDDHERQGSGGEQVSRCRPFTRMREFQFHRTNARRG